jgi:small subunit ribosomal protein S21
MLDAGCWMQRYACLRAMDEGTLFASLGSRQRRRPTLRALKKKMQREGVFREMKRRRFYEKPSERLVREKSEAVRRARKLARKKAQREGLLPAARDKKRLANKDAGRRGDSRRTRP